MNYQAFWKFIKLLSDNDLLQHIELVGSWCEYLYAQSGYLPGFTAGIRTLDIDFLIKNLRKPSKKMSLAKIAEENGYLVDHDVLSGSTKIYTPDLMEIEFLIEQKGVGTEPVLKTNLGVTAQALRHLGILKSNSITINMFNMEISLPSPEAYVIHKIIINEQRGKKSEKDLQAINGLWPFLDQEKVQKLVESLSKKEKSIVEKHIRNREEKVYVDVP
ncbi:MAG: hypothetical protein IKG76_02830 [Firmicutes bacterium]|nr:hypothetical protein [Bacillota bacterium]